MSTKKAKQAAPASGVTMPLLTPWRHDQPDQHGGVRVYDRSNEEILVCEEHHASAIVKAVNWCSTRGYIK